MNGTPRLRSAFPSTPQQQGNKSPQSQSQNGAPPRSPSQVSGPSLPDISSLLPAKPAPDSPLVPFTTIDAPTQRFYVASFYTALFFWRLWDFYHLTLDEEESLWLFMKWVSIDGVFLFGLPGLHIPWLEWSSGTMTMLFLLHSLFDGVLMFRIPIPLGAWLAGLAKVLYSSELAVSERRIKPSKLLHESSHYLGNAITVHILPEGSALLNPGNTPLCLDPAISSASVNIQIQINQTNPIAIDLFRVDLDSADTETISISTSQIKKLRKEAARTPHWQPSDPLILSYAVRKTGLYRLSRVMDESNMEVQRRASETLVVACPSAKVISSQQNRCRGDLSDMSIEVTGTPPLTIRYRRTVGSDDRTISYSSIQPEGFVSPLQRQRDSLALVPAGLTDVSWAARHKVLVPLNETLDKSGHWSYSIEEVADALGNTISYTVLDDFNKPKAKFPHSEGSLAVHDRPTLGLLGASIQRPLKVAAGNEIELPLRFESSSTTKKPIMDAAHRFQYLFTPARDVSARGDHSGNAKVVDVSFNNPYEKHKIHEPGLYTLQTVSTSFCSGEILEPAACILENPPKPGMTLSHQALTDRCAGRPIGVQVAFDFVGTPDFTVTWTETRNTDDHVYRHQQTFLGSRGELDLKPQKAGNYQYTFTEVSDKFYKSQSLVGTAYIVNQEVRPSVSATLLDHAPVTTVCPDESVKLKVSLGGEGPWVLEYEMLHSGKRHKYRVEDIKQPLYTIKTDKLRDGGEYTIALVAVTDKAGCKENLDKHEAKVFVRHQRPKAAFGKLEGKRTVRTLAGKDVELPVRLSGDAPWNVQWKVPGEAAVLSKTFRSANDFIRVGAPGIYEIVDVKDAHCPGLVDETANRFEVTGINRPVLRVPDSPLLTKQDDTFVRREVCEGEEDALDVHFEGRPPFSLKYQEHITLDQGGTPLRSLELNVPLQSAQIKMDTAKPGRYEYSFTELSDYNYDHDAKQHRTLEVQQRVNAKPSGAFVNPGKVYSFCQGQDGGSNTGEEVIPITLQGKPPFTIDVELKHNSRSSRPTPITFSNILTSSHDLRIPHHHLQPGNSYLTIRRVRDAHGCERQLDAISNVPLSGSSHNNNNGATISGIPPRVQISVHEPPSIIPSNPTKLHYCVGERLSYTLSGVTPFTVFYTFERKDRKATEKSPIFRRLAESAGNFTVTGIADAASNCRGKVDLSTVEIHGLPSVKVSHTHGHGHEKEKGRQVDIHAGAAAEILFEFGGVPPFEFTFTRSESSRAGAGRSKSSGAAGSGKVLETKTMVSHGYETRIKAGDEGTYEVVSVKDRFCAVARPGAEGLVGSGMGGPQAQIKLEGASDSGEKLVMDREL